MATFNEIVSGFLRGIMLYFLIYGKCQSGKTATLIVTIKILFDKMIELLARVKNSKILYIHITQSKSLLAVDQIKNRFNDENRGLIGYFEKSNIVPVGEISKANKRKNMCIVSMLHSVSTKKIINFVNETKNTWGAIVISIDEIDQGQEKGMIKRFDFIKDITEIYKNNSVKPYMATVVITATVANFSLSFRKMPKHVEDNQYAHSFYRNLFQSSIHNIAVPENENYLDPEEMISHECFRVLDYDTEMSSEKKIDTAFEKLNELDVKYKQYALINISRAIISHQEYADRVLGCGFNIAIIVNSQETTGYRMMYLSTKGEKKSFLINIKMLKKKADIGEMKEMAVPDNEGDFDICETGINSSIDINLIDIVNVFAKKGPLAKKLIIGKFANFPRDLPKERHIALVGCECFDRGNTLQDPSTCLVFTSVIHLDVLKGKDTTHGAKNYQKCGRVNGNIKHVYEDHLKFQMEYITEEKIMKVIMTSSKVIDNLVASGRNNTRMGHVVGQRAYDALVERSEVKIVEYMAKYNAELHSAISDDDIQSISPLGEMPHIQEEETSPSEEESETLAIVKRLVKLYSSETNNSIISKLFKDLVNAENYSLTRSVLEENASQYNSTNPIIFVNDITRIDFHIHKYNGLLFVKDNGFIKLSNEVISVL